jgi:hypothetical protein
MNDKRVPKSVHEYNSTGRKVGKNGEASTHEDGRRIK